MATKTQEFEGLKIEDAIRRYADPDLSRECDIDRRKWLADGGRTNFKIRNIRRHGAHWDGHNRRERAAKLIHDKYRNSLHRLRQSVQDLLSTGELIACGRRESPVAPVTAIPPSAWQHLGVWSYSKSVLVEKTRAKTKIFDVRIFHAAEDAAVVEPLSDFHGSSGAPAQHKQGQLEKPKKSVARVTAKNNSIKACRLWLSEIMRSNPAKPKPRDDYLKEALVRWPGTLGKRGFKRAWDEAVETTGADAWSASGRPKLNRQLIDASI